ncbi:polysaccharide pyruvyl transferase family protein [Roseomonas sp. GC11]|uniref:polysaccharide pyruvyl transferase family protein n=1 Tax=Roseomonas sp. GC11 TaxID=2950546 RepID=UPI0021098468|nr:polysaccharide pyruvyl transferase family protein [Roseomonas sp. GC11]MCQ4162176.1 polysaccharide pyruvyl transferase family protein [Roseomonas sp. GC11]
MVHPQPAIAGETSAAPLPAAEASQADFRVEAITCDHVILSAAAHATGLSKENIVLSIGGRRFATLSPAAFLAVAPQAGGERSYFKIRIPTEISEAANRPDVELRLRSTGELIPNGLRKPLPGTRRARALVLIPAGSRYDHDKIRLHNWPVSRIIDTYSNIGDLMVYDSTLKMLGFETVEVGNITTFTDKDVDRYNSEFDFAFLRGSNFIHEYMEWERAGELIERLKIPVFAIGVGAQAETKRMITLPAQGLRVWQAIADHCGAIGVRGAYSAEVLAHNGIRNAEVVGCPSVFRRCQPALELNLKPAFDIRNIAFSLRRETSGNYARHIARYLEIQRDFMLRLDQESRMTVTLHGEREEKAFFFRDVERRAEAIASLRQQGWLTDENAAQMLRIYDSQLFFNTSVAQYDEFIRTQDFAVGYRVHGVLPALANGVPGMLVNYDERSAELAETFDIPLVEEESLAKASWRDIYTPEAFAPFQRTYKKRYAAMKAYLDRNGVPHRL